MHMSKGGMVGRQNSSALKAALMTGYGPDPLKAVKALASWQHWLSAAGTTTATLRSLGRLR